MLNGTCMPLLLGLRFLLSVVSLSTEFMEYVSRASHMVTDVQAALGVLGPAEGGAWGAVLLTPN